MPAALLSSTSLAAFPAPAVRLPAEGGRLWGVYRAYEQSLEEAQPSEEHSERVRALWARQLAVGNPHNQGAPAGWTVHARAHSW